MNRLTTDSMNFEVMFCTKCADNSERYGCHTRGCKKACEAYVFFTKAARRLKKYEDTGLTPEEITALASHAQKYQTKDGVEVECDNCGTMIPLMEPKPGLVFIRQFCPFCGELLK
jgi:hypothetical protein